MKNLTRHASTDYTITRGDHMYWINSGMKTHTAPTTIQFGASQTIPLRCGNRDRISVWSDKGDADADVVYVLAITPGLDDVSLTAVPIDADPTDDLESVYLTGDDARSLPGFADNCDETMVHELFDIMETLCSLR